MRSRGTSSSRLREALGSEAAATLMEHLPPLGWADVATKRDLDSLDLRLDALEHRLLATFRAEVSSMQRTFILALVGSVSGSTLTAAGLAFAAARLV
ncbi:MAG: hypothetical protein M3N28_09560 [Actinomycetota bacterium]|nr:hypothetical protein [Actinomycetota bacterium]